MNILLYYSNFGNRGGPTVQVRSYAKVLVEAGHKVTVAGLGRPWWRPAKVEMDGVRYVSGLFFPKPKWLKKLGWDNPSKLCPALVRHIQENDYDIVHCVGWSPGTAHLLWAAKANGAKTIYTATGPGDRVYHGGFEKAGYLLDGVHAPAQSVVDEIASRMRCEGKRFVFPIAPDRLNKALDWSESASNSLAFLGHLDKHKKVDRLVDLWPKVVAREKNAKLHLFGSGNLERELKDVVKSLNLQSNIIFHGYEPNLEKVFANVSGLVVMAKEGLSLSAVEALCAGRSVILPHDGLFPEVYGGCSSVHFFDREATDDEVAEMLSSTLKRISKGQEKEESRGYYEQCFAPEVVGKSLLECYASLMVG